MVLSTLFTSFDTEVAYATLKPLLIFIVGVTIYSIFVFKFYRFLARREIFAPNLAQYNRSEHPFMQWLFNIFLNFVEYVLIFPLITFFWFIFLAILISFLSNQSPNSLFLVSMALIGSVRVTAHYSEDLSRDLAKMLPFALLGVFLLDISKFNPTDMLSLLRVLPQQTETLIYYLLFIVLLELFLRLAYGFLKPFRMRRRRRVERELSGVDNSGEELV